VLDPFAGSNVTGEVCERLERKWVAIELIEEYLKGSKFRFDEFCFGEWVERSGQRTFLLRDSSAKYEPPRSRDKKKRK